LQKAEELGVKVISEDDLNQLLFQLIWGVSA
jgi:BRCT domain type II-containing protein